MRLIRKECLISVKRLNNSKKGVTLVELVVSCTIMVLLAGACTAVLLSGQKLFLSSTQTANNQLEANLLQTTILKALPSAAKVSVKNLNDVKADTTGVGIYFDDNTFTVQNKGNSITVNNVDEFEFSFEMVGKEIAITPAVTPDPADPSATAIPAVMSDTARTQFVYTAKLEDGSEISGGIVLSNVIYKNSGVEGFSGVLETLTLSGNKAALYFEFAPQAGPTATP